MHICFCLFKFKNAQTTTDIDANMISVNKFFVHWVKETYIDERDAFQMLPTSNTRDIY